MEASGNDGYNVGTNDGSSGGSLLTAGKIYFYKDGSIQDSGTYAFDTVTNGPYFPMVAGYGGFNVTINFGASSFGQTVPSGYTSWEEYKQDEPMEYDYAKKENKKAV